MNIDKFKQPDGTFLDENGCSHDDAESFIQCRVLGFCCCGNPEKSLKYIMDCLDHVSQLQAVNSMLDQGHCGKDRDAAYRAWNDRGDEIMGKARWFTLYFLDREGLTEHGGNVSGAWLTTKGEELLEDIREMLGKRKNPPDSENNP